MNMTYQNYIIYMRKSTTGARHLTGSTAHQRDGGQAVAEHCALKIEDLVRIAPYG